MSHRAPFGGWEGGDTEQADRQTSQRNDTVHMRQQEQGWSQAQHIEGIQDHQGTFPVHLVLDCPTTYPTPCYLAKKQWIPEQVVENFI